MIGNDIIDLELTRIESNWKRKNFIEKLFTEEEQKLIAAGENPEIALWSLWSRKEAVYKIYHRQNKIRAFIPKLISCQPIQIATPEFLGEVIVNGFVYYTRTEINSRYIYTEAVAAYEYFQKIMNVNSADIAKDHDGIPYEYSTKNPVSVSHHGRYERCIQLDINS